jgi:hypothetical protein
MDEAIEASNEFDSSIKFLAYAYANKKKGTFDEEKAFRNIKRLSILMSAEPMFVIEKCGPFFLKYAEVIQKKEFEGIEKLDFLEEKQAYAASEDGSKHTSDAMEGKIRFLKKLFKEASDVERTEIVDHLVILLSSYCKYALAIKKLNKK